MQVTITDTLMGDVTHLSRVCVDLDLLENKYTCNLC